MKEQLQPRSEMPLGEQAKTPKEMFEGLVEKLTKHEDVRESYGASYKLSDDLTLTLLHNASFRNEKTGHTTPDQHMAFLVEKVVINGYTIRVRESYFSTKKGIHYGISIAGFTDPDGKHTIIKDKSGRPDHIYLQGSDTIPPEAKLTLLEKCVKEKNLSKDDKISELLKIMEEIDHNTRIDPKKYHFDWHGQKHILGKETE